MDFVRDRLGLPPFDPDTACERPKNLAPDPEPEANEPNANIDYARRIWNEAVAVRGSLAEAYLLHSRGLRLDTDLDWHRVLRFCPKAQFGTKKAPAMIALMRDIESNEPKGIQRTFLTKDGCKIARWMLGPAKGCAIKIDRLRPERKTLAIGEGLESTLAGRVFGYQPAWAVGSAGGIASFPVMPGIARLFIFAENDASNANEEALLECGERWVAAGGKVTAVRPPLECSDLNDALLSPPDNLQERAEASRQFATDFGQVLDSALIYSTISSNQRLPSSLP